MTDIPLSDTVSWIRSSGVDRRAAIAGTVAAAGYALAVQPVAAATITTDAEGLDAGMISFPAADRAIPAYRARPAGKTGLPVIIVVHEIFGVHEWVKDIVRRFAKAGYYAVAPDLFVRRGDATAVADIGTLVSTIVSKTPDAQVMSDLDALTAFVGTDGGNAAKTGITGFCWGGRVTWIYAAHNPKIRAGVAWYGRLTSAATELQPMVPIELVPQMKVPVYGLYGALDKGIPVADVAKMNAALKKAKLRSLIAVYDGADHGFMADYRPSYNEKAAVDAWGRALKWFARYLR
jgi:carboxymethylenebutenolidase